MTERPDPPTTTPTRWWQRAVERPSRLRFSGSVPRDALDDPRRPPEARRADWWRHA